jgi:hypothetical protein
LTEGGAVGIGAVVRRALVGVRVGVAVGVGVSVGVGDGVFVGVGVGVSVGNSGGSVSVSVGRGSGTWDSAGVMGRLPKARTMATISVRPILLLMSSNAQSRLTREAARRA